MKLLHGILEIRLPCKMHGSARGIKVFKGKLSIIEAVDLKFTSGLAHSPVLENPWASALPAFQSFSTYGASFPAILG
jgi:hypothetical protein